MPTETSRPASWSELNRLLSDAPAKLREIPPVRAAEKTSGWSKKEELGHLIDSATNNHQRITRSAVHGTEDFPGYRQDDWVALHDYQNTDWHELIELWHVLNVHLLHAAAGIEPQQWKNTCRVEGVAAGAPVTLQTVLDDYVEHMKHHLRHIGLPLTSGYQPDAAVASSR